MGDRLFKWARYAASAAVFGMSVTFATKLTGLVNTELMVGVVGSYAALLGTLYLLDRTHLEKGVTAIQRVERLVETGKLIAHEPNWEVDHLGVLRGSRSVTMVGLALQRLGGLDGEEVRKRLAEIVNTGGVVDLLLMSPFSPQLDARWRDETVGVYNKQTLARQTLDLLRIRNALTAKKRQRFVVQLFDSYPTFSLLMTEDELYTFTYTYGRTGLESPIIELKDGTGSPLRVFFSEAVKRLRSSATDAITRQLELEALAGA